MTELEMNQVVQYVLKSTSYGHEAVKDSLTTGFAELKALVAASTTRFNRGTLLKNVCRWTIAKTG
jgi:hypothetical protein